MKINYKKILAFVFSLGVFVIPIFIFATGSSAPTTPITIKNPLGVDDVNGLITRIMRLVFLVGSLIVVFFIIFSGYKFVIAKGNPGDLEKAKNMFYATVIGGAILLGADIIANVIITTVKNTATGR